MSEPRYELIDPQPTGRLLPYTDPISGTTWGVKFGENINAPDWAYGCALLSELHERDVKLLYPESSSDWSCYGPGCPGGEQGCNAKGCYGEREAFRRLVTGDRHGDAWVWISKGILTDMFPVELS